MLSLTSPRHTSTLPTPDGYGRRVCANRGHEDLAYGLGHATARQLDPGLGLTGPPPIKVFPFISQIEAWPLVF